MAFRAHREFSRSLNRLTYEDRKTVERQLTRMTSGEPTPGMRIHKVGSFLSFSPNLDLRVIASGPINDCVLLYVDHHDKAYEWASRHVGVSTLAGVEVFSVSIVGGYVAPEHYSVPPLLDRIASQYGNSEDVLDHISGLSPEWQEWFFQTYIEAVQPKPAPPSTSSFTFVPSGDRSLNLALELSSEEWLLYLHPTQRAIVEDDESRTLIVEGGPGTGKTVVLLSRLIRPVSNGSHARALLTYSQRLVKELRSVLRNGRIDVPNSCIVANLGDLNAGFGNSHFGYELHDDQLFRVNQRQTLRVPIEELIIDEFQDAEPDQIDFVLRVMGSQTKVTVGLDPGQTIFRKQTNFGSKVLRRADSHIKLTYCYRSSRQIMDVAYSAQREVLHLVGAAHEEARSLNFGLSGAPVPIVRCTDLQNQVRACDMIMRDLEKRFDPSELALIYLQYPNPAFKGPSKEEAALKNHPRLAQYYQFAPLTKGREFLAGVVFVSSTFLAKNMGPEASALRANIMHVALSRFRDEMTVVYPDGCPVSPALRGLVELTV